MPTFQFFVGGVKVDEMKGADPSALETKIKQWSIQSTFPVGIKSVLILIRTVFIIIDINFWHGYDLYMVLIPWLFMSLELTSILTFLSGFVYVFNF